MVLAVVWVGAGWLKGKERAGFAVNESYSRLEGKQRAESEKRIERMCRCNVDRRRARVTNQLSINTVVRARGSTFSKAK